MYYFLYDEVIIITFYYTSLLFFFISIYVILNAYKNKTHTKIINKKTKKNLTIY